MFLPTATSRASARSAARRTSTATPARTAARVYAPTDLKNPYSTLSGATPVLQDAPSTIFFQLSDPRCVEFLQAVDSTTPGRLQPEVVNKAQRMARRRRRQGARRLGHLARRALLRHRDPGCAGQVLLRLARRADRLPRHRSRTTSTKKGRDCERVRRRVPGRSDDRADPLHRQGHHLLPHAVLAGDAASSRGRTRCPTTSTCTASSPSRGEKMTKSRGTGISPLRYLELGMNPEWLRYYIAAKLNAQRRGHRLQSRRFHRARQQRPGRQVRQHRQPLRRASSIAKFGGKLAAPQGSAAARIRRPSAALLAALYEQREFGKALREIMALADLANQYVDEKQALGARQADKARRPRLQDVCSLAIDLFRLLTIYLKPVLPELAADAERFLNVPPLRWGDAAEIARPRDTASTSTATCSAASKRSSSTSCSTPYRPRSPRRRSATPRSSSTKPRSRP